MKTILMISQMFIDFFRILSVFNKKDYKFKLDQIRLLYPF